jgi:hypothetical protein
MKGTTMKIFRASEGHRGTVRLNGVEISHVLESSEEGRYLIRAKTDEQGRVVHEMGQVLTERLEGDVYFERR